METRESEYSGPSRLTRASSQTSLSRRKLQLPGMSLSAEEKRKLIKALEEDQEFRYAVAGLLGYREILDRITSLEERFATLEERFARLEDKFARLEERQTRLEEEMRDTRRVLTVIAHRFGIISESSFREGMKYVVDEVLGVAEVSRLTMRDEEGLVYGHPSDVEVDVVVRDDTHVLVEVKSRVSRGDVAELYRIGLLYERKYGVKPKLLIIGGFVDRSSWETASRLGVEIRPVVED